MPLGTILTVFSMMMLSLAKQGQVYQFFLSQGVLFGIGNALVSVHIHTVLFPHTIEINIGIVLLLHWQLSVTGSKTGEHMPLALSPRAAPWAALSIP